MTLNTENILTRRLKQLSAYRFFLMERRSAYKAAQPLKILDGFPAFQCLIQLATTFHDIKLQQLTVLNHNIMEGNQENSPNGENKVVKSNCYW